MSVCYHLGVSSLALLEHSETIHVVQLGPSQSFLRKIGNRLLIFLVQQNNEKWEIFFILVCITRIGRIPLPVIAWP